jgi:energy-coupling factor transporter ATP-binding protein EcfA2
MRLESVGKRYGLRQPWVVRSVSLDVLPGRLIRLEGRNGSGKSTLLRVAAGVSLPSKGRVTGRPHTGYVPERFPGGCRSPAATTCCTSPGYTVVCLTVGAAAGTLCNPPLLRHPGAAALATLAVAIVALAANVSPANAALRSDIASNTAARWPGAVSLIAAAALLLITWTASALAAARRERSLS